MRSILRAAAAMAAGGLFVLACGEAGEAPESAELGDLPAPAEVATTRAGPPPDTTAEALWAHLQSEAYRANWRLWPGTTPLYSGTEPHGMLLTTYANQLAQQALADGTVDDLPTGAIIVKENYMPDSTFDAATVMYKVDGYNPEHANWLFAKYDAQGNAAAFGRAPMCQQCHQQAESGYIYTAVQR